GRDDVAKAQKVGEAAAVRGEERREMAPIVFCADGPGEIGETQRIVAERLVEPVHHGRVRPLEAEACKLHAVAPRRARWLPGERLDDADGLARRLRVEHGEVLRWQCRRFVRAVVYREI